MSTVYKETFTKPIPPGAELFVRKGERFARWTDGKGRTRTTKVITTEAGQDRLLFEAATYTAKYRDGTGCIVKQTTGCRTLDAAKAVLVDLETRADKVRSGKWTAAEDSVLDYQTTPVSKHVAAYVEQLRNKRGKGGKPKVSAHHVANVEHVLTRITTDCGWKLLRDLNRAAAERWADQRDAEAVQAATEGRKSLSARTINAHLIALTAFGNWCVETGRLIGNPFARPPKRDEKANRRRTRRALTEDELRRLLTVARLRPLAEHGRDAVTIIDKCDRKEGTRRRTWTYNPLTWEGLEAAERATRKRLAKKPDLLARLEHRGRERALIYKALVLTGLRKGELASLTVGHLDLDGPVAFAVLDAADEKAGRGAEIPLRADLTADLRAWLADKLAALQDAARRKIGQAVPMRLPSDTPLFDIPDGLGRILDRDLAAAGIAKADDRGRTVDVHAMRHTFGTHLSKGGVAPRTAQAAMRHGSLDLTMNTYTDPRLLDVAGALNALPALPLDSRPEGQPHAATGTADASPLGPMLVPAPAHSGTSGANAGNSANYSLIATGISGVSANACKVSSSDRLATADKAQKEKRVKGFEPSTFSLGS